MQHNPGYGFSRIPGILAGFWLFIRGWNTLVFDDIPYHLYGCKGNHEKYYGKLDYVLNEEDDKVSNGFHCGLLIIDS